MREEKGTIIDVQYYRSLGIECCKTEGSDHYKKRGIEPIEYAIANGRFEDFAITSIIKYAERFKDTRSTDDLKKIADYAHILCGVEVHEKNKYILEQMEG